MEIVIGILTIAVVYLYYRLQIQSIDNDKFDKDYMNIRQDLQYLSNRIIEFKETQNIENIEVKKDLNYLNEELQKLKHGSV